MSLYTGLHQIPNVSHPFPILEKKSRWLTHGIVFLTSRNHTNVLTTQPLCSPNKVFICMYNYNINNGISTEK